MKNTQFFIRTLLAAVIWVQTSAAYGQKLTNEVLEFKGPQQTAEYIFRNSPKDVLISVQLFGSVARPGLYYVPEDTDLLKLLTLSGGVLNSSELEEVVVRKNDPRSWHNLNLSFVEQTNSQTYLLDIDNLLKDSPSLKPLRMAHQDFVYVPQKSPLINNDLYRIITIGAVILSATLTVLLIQEKR